MKVFVIFPNEPSFETRLPLGKRTEIKEMKGEQYGKWYLFSFVKDLLRNAIKIPSTLAGSETKSSSAKQAIFSSYTDVHLPRQVKVLT